MSLFNPYVILGFLVYSLAGGAFCVWQGYSWGDNSAKVEQLERTVATANETISLLQEATRRANAAAASYSQREGEAQEALAETERLIHELEPTPETPVADVCRIDNPDLQRLRDIANRAGRHQNTSGRTPIDVRPAGSGAPPP